MPPDDAARFLASSPDRQRLLAFLLDDSGSPADLAASLSLSRRSVQRHLKQFVERGWAEKAEGAYRLTMTGELVAEEHASYRDALETVEAFAPFFRSLPDREHTPDPRWLESATLTVATSTNPQAPVRRYVERVREFETDHVKMLSPVLSRLFHDAHADLALSGVHTELVLSAATIERARELNPAEFDVVVGVGVLDLYRVSDEIPLGLTLGGDRVLLGAYDDDGTLRACVESANPDVLEWAEGLFERYRDRGERVESSVPFPFTLGG